MQIDGVMSTLLICGAVEISDWKIPCALTVVPWGIEAIRQYDSGVIGSASP